MRQIVIGTTNLGKMNEYQVLLAGANIRLLSLRDIGLSAMDVEETGTTFSENAQIKAFAYAKASNRWALADDSGLCVDALGGAPGIYSARYGDIHTSEERRRYLLDQIKDVPEEKRTAYFECVIVIASPEGIIAQTEGRCYGSITFTELDEGKGFGYDPIFIPQGYDKTFGQLDEMIKHELSHRGIAARKMVELLHNLAIS
ncbi:MAG: non-canonical purine NTP pyrophosphatase, RdgB/HAM1 family [Phototrophicales bacterium]|nr:MAG: non-canonical purine NTP pyrophosphatase, RdgB/HAM1 family [Phototrophicales bacterium]